jgi:radical SAM superfamily enzyme YgiQ (UPF0313 family)
MKTVGLVQINNSFSGQSYFPYSVGVLQAYAQRHLPNPGDFKFLIPIFERIPVEKAVEHLAPADIVGFSAYVWNFRLSLAIARELKRLRPETLIVFGGPQVPNYPDKFMAENPFVDVVVHSEGEKPFTQILENLETRDWNGIPSLSYRGAGGLVQTPRVERMRDLDSVPSPYLEGTFDPLMESLPGRKWIVIWETNRGCPFGCTFCDWGSNMLAKIGKWGLERLKAEVDWFAEKKIFYVFNADANFGILPRDLEIAEYFVATKKRTDYPSKFSVQNTKSTTRDAMEKSWRVQKVLSDGGLNQGVVVSMQSLHPPTLAAIKRDNMKPEFFKEIQERFTKGGVETMSDLILGLPEETYDSFVRGVSSLIEGGQHNRIQFQNLSILPNAEMGDPAYQERYGMEMVTSRIVNIHGSKAQDDEVPEIQQLVIATKAMPRADWVRTRAFAWWVSLLHFDKVLQEPLVLCHEFTRLPYHILIELFSEEGTFPESRFPEIGRLRRFFRDKARDIQNGGEEYCHSKDWLDIWWPADEYALIQMTVDERLGEFYGEAERILSAVCCHGFLRPKFISDSVFLSQSLLKRPFQTDDLTIVLSLSVRELHRMAVEGKRVTLHTGQFTYRIDRTSERWDTWNDWFERVIWWGNKRGAYQYSAAPALEVDHGNNS